MLSFSLLLLFFLLTDSSSASDDGLSNELRVIRKEMGSLRDENQRQNMAIASLKETLQLQNKTINQHETTIEKLTNLLGKYRRKRPAQLIPDKNLSIKRKNENGQPNRNRFYGPPTNCSDLIRLGYTLNGFYLVKNPLVDSSLPPATPTNFPLETVYCAFKQEGTYNQFLVQLAVMPSLSTSIFNSLNHLSSSSTSPPLKLGQEVSKTTKGRDNFGNRFPRMGYLVNGFGNGILPYAYSNKSGFTLHQGRADHTSWSWNEASLGSGDRHLCNQIGKCATSYKIDPVRPQEPSFVRQEDYMEKEGQRFHFLELPSYPGFFIIKDDFEKCVAIYGNMDRHMAEVRAIDCNPSEAGQRWKWSYP